MRGACGQPNSGLRAGSTLEEYLNPSSLRISGAQADSGTSEKIGARKPWTSACTSCASRSAASAVTVRKAVGSDLGQRCVISAVQPDFVTPSSDPSHQVWIVSRHLTDNKHSPRHAPFVEVTQQLVGNRGETRLDRFVRPMILKIKRKSDACYSPRRH